MNDKKTEPYPGANKAMTATDFYALHSFWRVKGAEIQQKIKQLNQEKAYLDQFAKKRWEGFPGDKKATIEANKRLLEIPKLIQNQKELLPPIEEKIEQLTKILESYEFAQTP